MAPKRPTVVADPGQRADRHRRHPRAHLRDGRRPAPDGRVEPGVPAGRVGGRRHRAGRRRQVRRPQPGRAAGLMRWSRQRPGAHRRARTRVRLRHRGGRPRVHRVALPLRARRGRHPGHRVLRGQVDPVWARILDVPTNRHRELRDGMRHTLEQLKTAAEAMSRSRRPAMTLKVAPARYLLGCRIGRGALVLRTACSRTRRPVTRRSGTWRWPRCVHRRASGSPRHRTPPRRRSVVHPRRGSHLLARRRAAHAPSAGTFVFGPRMVDHRFRVDSARGPLPPAASPRPDSRTSPERADRRRLR